MSNDAWRNRIVGHGEADPRSLRANPANWRTHPPGQRAALADVLDQVGVVQNVIVNRTHLRVDLAVERGEPAVPYVEVELSEDEERVVLATLDPLSALAEADADRLGSILADLRVDGPALSGMLDELAESLADVTTLPPAGRSDDTPPGEAPVDPVTQPGDLLVLGSHRLLCGDATDAEAIRRLVDGAPVDIVFIDPPYGIGYQDVQRRFRRLANDDAPPARLVTDALSLVRLENGLPIYICCDWRSLQSMRDALRAVGQAEKALIVWDKQHGVQNLDRYHKQHEFVLYAGPYGGEPTLRGDVWTIAREPNPGDHPTPKPVELAQRALSDSGRRAGQVLDLFAGSGSTVIAAENVGMRALAMEIDPAYCDVIVDRWERHTGGTAERERAPE